MSRSIGALDAAPAAAFEADVAPLFESAPRFLARLAAARPFGSWEVLFARARVIAHAMPESEQVELVDAHPRLGAPPGSLSEHSFREQGYDREAAANLASEAARERELVAAELDRLNRDYEARFGFRYCVFVAGRPLTAIVPELESALGLARADELHRALDAVVDIADARRRASG